MLVVIIVIGAIGITSRKNNSQDSAETQSSQHEEPIVAERGQLLSIEAVRGWGVSTGVSDGDLVSFSNDGTRYIQVYNGEMWWPVTGHIIALTDDNRVYDLGPVDGTGINNPVGGAQPSQYPARWVEIPEDVVSINTSQGLCAAVTSSGHVYSWNVSDDGMSSPEVIEFPESIVEVSLDPDNDHDGWIVAVSETGVAYGIRYNRQGSDPQVIATGIKHIVRSFGWSVAVSRSGEVTYWYGDRSSAIGVPIPEVVSAVSVSHSGMLALSEHGNVYHWRTPYSMNDPPSTPAPIFSEYGRVLGVSEGAYFSLALTEDGRLLFRGYAVDEDDGVTQTVLPVRVSPDSFLPDRSGFNLVIFLG